MDIFRIYLKPTTSHHMSIKMADILLEITSKFSIYYCLYIHNWIRLLLWRKKFYKAKR